ncbi:MAG: YifB family Mg chelatase-like AAA ATPase, partial [Butyrivibrio sp.]|nr:YifB family Mg chelatase-like AAA ATPase [Butyrivibrio sp.]
FKDSETEPSNEDFADINGQAAVKRAVEIAAAGFHHVLVVGPPGSGKSMVAKRIPTILPPLSVKESLEVSTIYSVAGMLGENDSLITKRPFVAPHHMITETALVGGGQVPRPGVISLSHRGVLFLDEMPEFPRNKLDMLRQPIEDRKVNIVRSKGNFIYPADFQLVGALNPCPCGYYPDRNKCKCTPNEIRRYLGRISGPILDRIDICVEAPRVDISDLTEKTKRINESSATIRQRVMKAREIQEKRFNGTELKFNSEMSPKDIKKYCKLGIREENYLEDAFCRMELSARAYHKVLRVARTIADIDGSENIQQIHLCEALSYRLTDGKYWHRNEE